MSKKLPRVLTASCSCWTWSSRWSGSKQACHDCFLASGWRPWMHRRWVTDDSAAARWRRTAPRSIHSSVGTCSHLTWGCQQPGCSSFLSATAVSVASSGWKVAASLTEGFSAAGCRPDSDPSSYNTTFHRACPSETPSSWPAAGASTLLC